MDLPALSPTREPGAHRGVITAVVVLSLLYVVTHGGNLGRELTCEEGYFTVPGRGLFENGVYEGYFGENLRGGSSSHNPFHKPPGVSLVLGAFSFLSADGVTGARLAPFLVGWLAMLLPLLLTRSLAPSLVLLVAPFLYAGSSHMQTDPVIGLVGYGCCLVYWHGVWRGQSRLGWLVTGCIVLWTGKLEIAAIAAAASAIATLLLLRADDLAGSFRRVWRDLVVANLVGAGSFVLLTWSLGRTAGYGFGDSVGYVIGTILRIGKTLDVNAASSRPALFRGVANFQGWQLCIVLATPVLVGWLVSFACRRRRLGTAARGLLLTFAAFGVLPFLVYGVGGYAGDGYPRYFIIAYLALAVATGVALVELERSCGRLVHGLANAALLGTAAVLFVPSTVAMMREPGTVTVMRGTTGWRHAALLADALAQPGSWIVGPERCHWYGRARPWLILDSFDPYPAMRELTFAFADKVGAVILPRTALTKPVEFSETTLLPRLLAAGEWDRFPIADTVVWVRR
jgi:hypothetical protein